MKFLCYRAINNLPKMGKYSYCAGGNGSFLHANDLAGLGDILSQFAEYDGDPKGFILYGNIKRQNIRERHLSNPKGLPKRVLEELALIISNKTSSKREILVEA